MLETAATARGLRWITSTPDTAAGTLASLGEPVAVVAVASAGSDAVEAASKQGGVAAMVVAGASLSPPSIGTIGDWPELPVLAVTDFADREGVRSAVDAYLASAHERSDIIVAPVDQAVADEVAGWLHDRLAGRPRMDEVVLHSEDGWELFGTRWLPTGRDPAAGIVLLHSGRSDRAVFARLERLLSERGFAVLNLDWRGRGQSTKQGAYMDLSAQQRADGWRDAEAAFAHLAECAEVDPARLAAVGVIHGAEHAVRAARHDPRVKALVILTGYRPADDSETAYLTGGTVDVLYVTSSAHRITTAAMRALYDATPPGHARYVEYQGGAIGYQLFELDHQLEPAIVTWLSEALSEVLHP